MSTDYLPRPWPKQVVQKVLFYSDNCGGQNRNKFIALIYMEAVIAAPLQSITHKFLETGHTQNERDSMHSTIEQAKGTNPLFTPQQFYYMARTAKTGDPYSVDEMTKENFLDWKELTNLYAPN